MNFGAGQKGIDLHLHLYGAVRPRTLFELAHSRNIPIPYTTPEELEQALLPTKPYKLANFLKGFYLLLPILAGDKSNLGSQRKEREFTNSITVRSREAFNSSDISRIHFTTPWLFPSNSYRQHWTSGF
ncbi:Adenosine deaminase [Clonorchis sinensis]|uniref:Adenosine deaminase n=1 Tax=Clonorchis sinensis TaxID=79923 RepID=A0A3R7H7Z9_CLOSI|nr:Adenosine deaminase [Clonorchis sinensis]